MFPTAYFPATYFPPTFFPETGAEETLLGPGGGYFPGGFFPRAYFAPSYFPQVALPASSPGPFLPPIFKVPKFTPPAAPLNYVFDGAFYLWPRSEGVTLQKLSSTPDGSDVSDVTVSWAYRGILADDEKTPTAGAYQGMTIVWRLPLDLLGGVVPYPGDLVIDSANVKYKLTAVHKANVTSEYRCQAINLSLYLPDIISIERPTYSQDAYKLDQPNWIVIYDSIQARMQPSTLTIDVEDEVATEVEAYDAIIGQQLSIQSNDRVLWNGTYYNVLKYIQALRITDFPILQIRSTN